MGRKSEVHENWSIRRHQDGAIEPRGDGSPAEPEENVRVTAKLIFAGLETNPCILVVMTAL